MCYVIIRPCSSPPLSFYLPERNSPVGKIQVAERRSRKITVEVAEQFSGALIRLTLITAKLNKYMMTGLAAYPFHFGKSGFSAYFFTPSPDIRILSGFFCAGPYRLGPYIICRPTDEN